jgi:cellulose synthase/poly-beta-1,6-N-acetylglucosamine synthase-like glycosyltransferase
MISAQEISLFVYNLALIPLIFVSVLFLIIVTLNLFVDKKSKANKKNSAYVPMVSIQVPVFNDPVAARCLDACNQLEYPKDKYEIIIVDDSTNIKTQRLMQKYANRHAGIKYIHRDNRNGYKAGALMNAMPITKGEIVVIFDADFIPEKNFLKSIVEPFKDPKIAIVQGRQGFINHKKNLISRFAAYMLMAQHTILMPINNRINCVFFCGTAGAIRKKAIQKIGGWSHTSFAEDSELSFRLLSNGYKTAYIPIETPSEVPETIESFVKQQMRWTYGNTRVFMDNKKKILFGKGLSLKQRMMIVFLTMGNIAAPFVILTTIFGFAGWFLGDPKIMNLTDLATFLLKFIYTGGFLILGFIMFYKQKRLNEFGYLILSAFSVSIILATANTIAFCRALLHQEQKWICTPKISNKEFIKQ